MKVVINRRTVVSQPTTTNGRLVPSTTTVHTGVYITYSRKEDAARAIEAVDGSTCETKVVRYF